MKRLLVSRVVRPFAFVAVNMARRQGATRERIHRDTRTRSNAGAGPFSPQPEGLWGLRRFTALLARAISQRIQLLPSRLEKRRNPLRQRQTVLPLGTLVCLLLVSASTALFADITTREVQQKLSDLGFYYSEVDGVLGPETEAAIRRYQIRNGLSVTGTLNEQTLEKLQGRGGGTPSVAQREQPRVAPSSGVIESDRAFLESESGSGAEERESVRREENRAPDDERWRGRPPKQEISPLDFFFAGTPWARANREVQREMLVRAQIQLRRYRYYFGEIDGIPGRMTTRAIEEFQWDENLPITGRLDGATIRALGLRYGGFYRTRRSYEEPPRLYFRGYWVR